MTLYAGLNVSDKSTHVCVDGRARGGQVARGLRD